jgi:hypothetical protein
MGCWSTGWKCTLLRLYDWRRVVLGELRRPPEDDLDLGADEDEDDEGDDGEGGSKKKKPKKPPPHPEEPMLLWLPAVMLELADPGIVEEFEGIENAKARKKQEAEQRKKDRAEGTSYHGSQKQRRRTAKTEDACPTTPTKRKSSTTSKKKDNQSQAGAIAKTFKVTKKKPVAGGDKGKAKTSSFCRALTMTMASRRVARVYQLRRSYLPLWPQQLLSRPQKGVCWTSCYTT